MLFPKSGHKTQEAARSAASLS